MTGMSNDPVREFWLAFLHSDAALPGLTTADQPDASGYGDSPALADELGQLIYAGIKTATCSALWEYEHDGEPLPSVGMLDIVLDGQGRPLCITETTEVTVRPYNEVDAAFAYAEGEGDRTLAYWRQAHWRFFARTLPRIGRAPTETMPLVCERLRVIYKK
ncbi:MAG: ASCH domain-containing protein [Caldilineaceae bacterium]